MLLLLRLRLLPGCLLRGSSGTLRSRTLASSSSVSSSTGCCCCCCRCLLLLLLQLPIDEALHEQLAEAVELLPAGPRALLLLLLARGPLACSRRCCAASSAAALLGPTPLGADPRHACKASEQVVPLRLVERCSSLCRRRRLVGGPRGRAQAAGPQGKEATPTAAAAPPAASPPPAPAPPATSGRASALPAPIVSAVAAAAAAGCVVAALHALLCFVLLLLFSPLLLPRLCTWSGVSLRRGRLG